MARRENLSPIASASEIRNRAKRAAAREAALNAPAVSNDAALKLIERECDKAGREWYTQAVDAWTIAKEISAEADDLKHARQLVLDRIEEFPVMTDEKVISKLGYSTGAQLKRIQKVARERGIEA